MGCDGKSSFVPIDGIRLDFESGMRTLSLLWHGFKSHDTSLIETLKCKISYSKPCRAQKGVVTLQCMLGFADCFVLKKKGKNMVRTCLVIYYYYSKNNKKTMINTGE